ncbi:hypothetical protein ACFZAB_31195, partial [Streptomyces albogriseolus]|uniref:hypothetical protein n=1 Tax=Streptomyces albogriseolus TaxID=1887 RepID=UPI0036F1643D
MTLVEDGVTLIEGAEGGTAFADGDATATPVPAITAIVPRPFLSDHRIVGLGVSLTDAQWARIEPLLPDR